VLNLLEEMEHSTVKLETHDQDVQNCVKHRRLKAWEQVMISALLCMRLEIFIESRDKIKLWSPCFTLSRRTMPGANTTRPATESPLPF